MREKKEIEAIAIGRINRMFIMAVEAQLSDPVLSRRYICIMEKIAMRADITLSSQIKRSYCKRCKNVYPGNNRIRLKNKLVRITCLYCGDIRKIPTY
ncbi:MAG: ribonuclease P protein component 4 [Thermoplasmataceae archaeon]